MVNLLDQLEELTVAITGKLQQVEYEELAEFVDRRELILERIRAQEAQQPFLARNSDRVRRILEHDHAIMGRMLELKNVASDSLARMDQGKKQKSAYEAAYSPDSYFFDMRK